MKSCKYCGFKVKLIKTFLAVLGQNRGRLSSLGPESCRRGRGGGCAHSAAQEVSLKR